MKRNHLLSILLFVILNIVFAGACKSQMAQKYAPKSLCKAYDSYFPIGAALSPKLDFSSEERKEWIPEHFNSLTPENQLKPKFIHPKEEIWNWEPADEIIAYAVSNDMKVRGHTLMWYQSTPEWMVKDGESLASKDLLLERMQHHIETVMTKYKNYIYCWDVVNEAISNNDSEVFRPDDPLYQILGEDYIAEAFKIAHEVDPNCQLYYNDYRFSDPVKRQKIYELMKRMKEKGVPIDGIGFQFHLVPDEITEEYFQETIDLFSGLGLKIQITELEISVYNYRTPKHPDKDINDDAYTPQRIQKQAEMYDMVMRVCRENKKVVEAVTLWATGDSRDNFRTKLLKKMDYPFLFDEYMKPKPFINSIINFK